MRAIKRVGGLFADPVPIQSPARWQIGRPGPSPSDDATAPTAGMAASREALKDESSIW